MVDLNSSVYWRIVKVGHSALRWSDELLPSQSSHHQSAPTLEDHPEIYPTEESVMPTIRAPLHHNLLNLCELELHQHDQLSFQTNDHDSCYFPQWDSLAQLCTSKSLGAVGLIRYPDNSLWINLKEGQFRPRALLAQWLAQHLPPELVLGESPKQAAIQGLLWIRSLGHSPLLSARIYQSLSELPFPSGGALSQGIATLMGAIPPEKLSMSQGIWGILDVGAGSASWSLIEVNHLSSPHDFIFQELSVYRQSWVGTQALMRALLNNHLNQRQLIWRDLSTTEREQWAEYTYAQAIELLRLSWPSHLQHRLTSHVSLDAQAREASSIKVFKQFQNGTYLALVDWISHSLSQNHIGPEALRGIWVTGLQGGSLVGKLRRLFSSVNIRVATEDLSMIGAQRFARFALSASSSLSYRAREVSLCTLRLYDHYEEVAKPLLSEQTRLPVVLEVAVGPTQGMLSLQLSTYGGPQMILATHPPLKESKTLRIYYEGPHLFELEWVESSSRSHTSNFELECRDEMKTTWSLV